MWHKKGRKAFLVEYICNSGQELGKLKKFNIHDSLRLERDADRKADAALAEGLYDCGHISAAETQYLSQGGSLYVTHNGMLQCVAASSPNAAKKILGPSDWSGATSSAMLGDNLYVIQANRLHKVDRVSG
ncbi:MAG TPA: hypothetical protein VE954_14480, partial [Oligoflexus sp.]|uniref:hypothetical protein n=1 Tax=Oligoflexus sp. TaxID=1971216 RepID=UPI002D42B35B